MNTNRYLSEDEIWPDYSNIIEVVKILQKMKHQRPHREICKQGKRCHVAKCGSDHSKYYDPREELYDAKKVEQAMRKLMEDIRTVHGKTK